MKSKEKPKKQATLCLVLEKDRLLLAMKKRGFGAGKYNGFGGKVNPGETIEQAAVREFNEESSLNAHVEDLVKVGEFDFYFPHKPEFNQTVHTYLIRKISGIPKETEEMTPKWFRLNDIPYSQMWDDDRYWVQSVIEGKKLRATFVFKNENGENIVDRHEILEVDEL